jgi:hypothetical protein
MFLKNQSILKQAEASDQFAFYQSKSVKAQIDEGIAALATEPETKARFQSAKQREDQEKAGILVEAKKLQEESRKLGEESAAKLKPHERLALALTFIQIAIALAALTILTRRRWLLWGSVLSAAGGVLMAATAFA